MMVIVTNSVPMQRVDEPNRSVFVSWSGEMSKAVALLLRTWLPSVIQAIDEVWVSDVDIQSGSNWSTSIGSKLETTDFGIICVTQENQDRPWLNFEAGAISKLVKGAAPLLIDFPSKNDLNAGPISALQVQLANEDGMHKMIFDLNREMGYPLKEEVLAVSFRRSYPEFAEALAQILADEKYSKPQRHRSNDDKIDEILALARQMSGEVPNLLNQVRHAVSGISFGEDSSRRGFLTADMLSRSTVSVQQAAIEDAQVRLIVEIIKLVVSEYKEDSDVEIHVHTKTKIIHVISTQIASKAADRIAQEILTRMGNGFIAWVVKVDLSAALKDKTPGDYIFQLNNSRITGGASTIVRNPS